MKIQVANICLSNKKIERLGNPLDDRVAVSAHKFNVIMALFMTSLRDKLPKPWLLHFFAAHVVYRKEMFSAMSACLFTRLEGDPK